MSEKDEKIKAEILEDNTEKKEIKNDDTNKQENEERIKNEKEKYEAKQTKKQKRKHRIAIIAIIIFIILIITTILSTVFALLNSGSNKILKGIYVKNISLEGLTIDEANKILKEKYEYEKSKEITLNVEGEKFSITPEQFEIEYNIEEAVNNAFSIGRDGNIFQNNFEILKTFFEKQEIEIEILYNEKLLENILAEISAKLPDAVQDNTYYINEDKLIITRGKSGRKIDLEVAENKIIEAIKNEKVCELNIDTKQENCPEIDIEKIYKEVYSEPQNATYTTDPFEIIPHKNGIKFDIEQAKEILKEEKEEYTIELIITEPDILVNEIGEEAYPDLLGSYNTKFDETNIPRTKNVKLALEKLNGTVVMPGETFSYNKTLGKRTKEAGYDYANGYQGGRVVPMLGGGICQVSSTLYDAVLYSNLEIVERHNHMFQAQYIGAGRDATVVYGSLDFKFKNTRKYPVMIKTQSNGGLAVVQIFGKREEVEYEIEIVPEILEYLSYKVVYENDASLDNGKERVAQYGITGCKTKTYKITKLNGQEIKKEVISTDTYDPCNKIVKRGTKVTTSEN